MINKRRKSLVSAVLILSLCMGMGMHAGATSIDEAKKKAEELEAQKKATAAEQNSLSAQLNTILGEMQTAQEKLNVKQDEIQKNEEELVQAKVEENNQYESMKKRIKFMYENGNVQFLEVLLASESISDFLNKAEYVSQISEYDRNMLTEFQVVVKQVEEQEEALKKEYTELKTLQDSLIEKQGEVQAVLNEKNVQLANLESAIGENASTLANLIAEAEAEAEKQRQQAAAASASSGGSAFVPGSGSVVVSGNGQFTNPCPGASVSSSFGYRDFDSSFHNGLDLAAPEGTPTYAADAGTVMIAGWSDSAGNWVVINHGNGFVTKYMHHSAISVSAGQSVSKGQQIGYVGNTGNSFGAHLHFQVELNGSPVNPQSYL